MKEIYRYYSDTEVTETCTNIECPYCHDEWCEVGKDECGVTYVLHCETCNNKFEMHFDAD